MASRVLACLQFIFTGGLRSAGIKRVLVPKHNWRDIQADIPDNIKGGMEIIPVHVLEDVLQQAFTPPLHLTPVSKL